MKDYPYGRLNEDGSTSDPLGLTVEQRARSNQARIVDTFVRMYGDRIKMDATGKWYVEHEGRIVTVPLPDWPAEDAAGHEGMTLGVVMRIARQS